MGAGVAVSVNCVRLFTHSTRSLHDNERYFDAQASLVRLTSEELVG
jgi:hypothetical protein